MRHQPPVRSRPHLLVEVLEERIVLSPSNVNLNLVAPQINENQAAMLSGTFNDGGMADNHTVTIDWGPNQGPPQVINLNPGVTSFMANHPYLNNLPDDAAYPISVTVANTMMDSAVGNTQVVVQNVLPSSFVVNTNAPTINENQVLNLNGSFTDPGTLDGHRVTIYWGFDEGSTTLNLPPGQTTFNANHQYLDNPSGATEFFISVAVLDSDTFHTPSGPIGASNFVFEQFDFYDAANVLQIEDSLWGSVAMDVNGDPNQVVYLNVVADDPGNLNAPAWIVKNMPIFPDHEHQVADFNIGLLGLAQGTDLTTIDFLHTVTPNIVTIQPTGTLTNAPVTTHEENRGVMPVWGNPLCRP